VWAKGEGLPILRKASTNQAAAIAAVTERRIITKRLNKGVMSVLLHTLASSGMAAKTIGKSPGSVDAFGLTAKRCHQRVLNGTGTQDAASVDIMAIPAGAGSCCPEDQIAMRIGRLFGDGWSGGRCCGFGMSRQWPRLRERGRHD
jgi:hypothetical protein